MEEEARKIRPARRVEDQSRGQHQRVRVTFFVGTGIAGFLVALVCLTVGLYLDLGIMPYRVWSLVSVLVGGCVTIAVSQAAASLYRRYRRRLRQ